jgi:hypothetical protein
LKLLLLLQAFKVAQQGINQQHLQQVRIRCLAPSFRRIYFRNRYYESSAWLPPFDAPVDGPDAWKAGEDVSGPLFEGRKQRMHGVNRNIDDAIKFGTKALFRREETMRQAWINKFKAGHEIYGSVGRGEESGEASRRGETGKKGGEETGKKGGELGGLGSVNDAADGFNADFNESTDSSDSEIGGSTHNNANNGHSGPTNHIRRVRRIPDDGPISMIGSINNAPTHGDINGGGPNGPNHGDININNGPNGNPLPDGAESFLDADSEAESFLDTSEERLRRERAAAAAARERAAFHERHKVRAEIHRHLQKKHVARFDFVIFLLTKVAVWTVTGDFFWYMLNWLIMRFIPACIMLLKNFYVSCVQAFGWVVLAPKCGKLRNLEDFHWNFNYREFKGWEWRIICRKAACISEISGMNL